MHRFSIIVPTFNGAAFLEQTLDSLAAQTFGDFEVVVVDDGSDDGSADVASAHRVGARVHRQENRGVAVARNKGASLAVGEWLAFLDQDDLWHRRRLERLDAVIGATDSSFIVTPDRMFGTTDDQQRVHDIDQDVAAMADVWVEPGTELELLCRDSSLLDLEPSFGRREITVEELLRATVVTTTSFVVRADFMRLVGGWSLHGRSLDDWWLMVNAARVEPLLMVDEPTHFYRIHSRATSLKPGLFFALASSVLALRYGGNVMTLDEALHRPHENQVLRHLFLRTISSPAFADDQRFREDVSRLGTLLWPDGWAAQRVRRQRVKHVLRRLVG